MIFPFPATYLETKRDKDIIKRTADNKFNTHIMMDYFGITGKSCHSRRVCEAKKTDSLAVSHFGVIHASVYVRIANTFSRLLMRFPPYNGNYTAYITPTCSYSHTVVAEDENVDNILFARDAKHSSNPPALSKPYPWLHRPLRKLCNDLQYISSFWPTNYSKDASHVQCM